MDLIQYHNFFHPIVHFIYFSVQSMPYKSMFVHCK